jgi:hypothetical protein
MDREDRKDKKIEIETVIAKEIILEEDTLKEETIIPLELDEKDIKDLHKFQYLFLFVNPISGSQEGKFIFEIFKDNGIVHEKHGLVLELPANDDRINLKVFLFDITLSSCYELGINVLKKHLENLGKLDALFKQENKQPKDTLVLIGGGDGTVLSVIENLNKNGIDEKLCIFGHIPLGTGNDLANTLGFGCNF